MIEILSIRPLMESGTVRAFVDFRIEGKLTIKGAKVIQQAGQQAWVAMPDRQYEQDGETRWAPIVKIEDAGLREKIQVAILAAWEAEDAA